MICVRQDDGEETTEKSKVHLTRLYVLIRLVHDHTYNLHVVLCTILPYIAPVYIRV